MINQWLFGEASAGPTVGLRSVYSEAYQLKKGESVCVCVNVGLSAVSPRKHTAWGEDAPLRRPHRAPATTAGTTPRSLTTQKNTLCGEMQTQSGGDSGGRQAEKQNWHSRPATGSRGGGGGGGG